jgi:hypothetical protein
MKSIATNTFLLFAYLLLVGLATDKVAASRIRGASSDYSSLQTTEPMEWDTTETDISEASNRRRLRRENPKRTLQKDVVVVSSSPSPLPTKGGDKMREKVVPNVKITTPTGPIAKAKEKTKNLKTNLGNVKITRGIGGRTKITIGYKKKARSSGKSKLVPDTAEEDSASASPKPEAKKSSKSRRVKR